MIKNKKKYGNFPYCGNPNYPLGMNKDFNKTIKNPLEKFMDAPEVKNHFEKLKNDREHGLNK